MSTLTTAARNAARNAVNALVDAGVGTYPTLRLQTSGDADLLVINLNTTKAIADAVAGVSTMNPPDGEGTWVDYQQLPGSAGVVAKGVVCDKDSTVVETASVGTTGSGEEIELTSLTLATDIPVKFSAAPTLTQRETYDPTP
jgi:hypothetical protein